MATLVYVLCAVASLVCTMLLVRGWQRTRARMLLHSSLCFLLLTLSQVALVVDLVIAPDADLLIYRQLLSALGVFLLVWGFIWDGR
jgi:hypothetical protein